MRRIHIVSLLGLIVALPVAAANTFFALDGKIAHGKPCFVAGDTGYQISAAGKARHTVRIDNDAARPHLRMQLVDDPAAADFVLVDDSDATTCEGASVVESINIDPTAAKPDLIVGVSRQPSGYKIYLHSKIYNEQEAAALAAVIWQNTSRTGSLRSSTLNR